MSEGEYMGFLRLSGSYASLQSLEVICNIYLAVKG